MKISEGLVIVLNSYEKNSFLRFFLIYITAFIMLFFAISFLYYYKERNRYFQEEKTKNKLEYLQCMRFNKLLQKSEKPCVMKMVVLNDKVFLILKEIVFAFLLALLLIIPLGYILAQLSLRPMRDSVQKMDDFIGGIVHDINTPLSVIKMNAQSIHKNIQNEKIEKKSERVMQGIEQIESLEEQLLFTLKIKQYTLEKKYFDLGESLSNRIEYWNDMRRTLQISLTQEPCSVFADERALLRMLDNIVNNSIKYSPANSEIKITLAKNILTIADQGIGIKKPKEIFEKYYRESNDSNGVGIGLYIVYQIAKLHGIKIKVNSKIGVGTQFHLNLEEIQK